MPPAIATAAANPPLDIDIGLTALMADLQTVVSKANGGELHIATLLQRAFEMAAITEQTLAEQQDRINYLESLSVTDELTGLLNRRGFLQVLDKVLANARRHHECGMLAFLDLDKFKVVNDTYGHGAGDAVLQEVANLLLNSTRSTDYVARLGGDEFVILFCRAKHMPTRARAIELQTKLNNLIVSHSDARVRVKASMGLQIYGPYSEAEDLLCQADHAMYAEKEKRQSMLAEAV